LKNINSNQGNLVDVRKSKEWPRPKFRDGLYLNLENRYSPLGLLSQESPCSLLVGLATARAMISLISKS
jgi:hypothetical protein